MSLGIERSSGELKGSRDGHGVALDAGRACALARVRVCMCVQATSATTLSTFQTNQLSVHRLLQTAYRTARLQVLD